MNRLMNFVQLFGRRANSRINLLWWPSHSCPRCGLHQICAEERVAGIEFSGTPLDKVAGMEAVELLKKAGVKMFHKVGSLRHALHAEKIGFDGIYAAGVEEGGHPLNDDVTSMVLTPKIASSLKIPVVTVGGIADGRTMAAALALGADGVAELFQLRLGALFTGRNSIRFFTVNQSACRAVA